MSRRAPAGGRWGGPLEPVGPLVGQLLGRLGLERKLEEYRAVEAWPEVVGTAIASQTRAVAVREGILFVDVASSVWMQELGLLRDGIVARLNARLGSPLVRKIVLSIERGGLPGTGPDGRPRDWEVEEPHVE
jgi:predicted nucleic acid-binding Zn ribbon protein